MEKQVLIKALEELKGKIDWQYAEKIAYAPESINFDKYIDQWETKVIQAGRDIDSVIGLIESYMD